MRFKFLKSIFFPVVLCFFFSLNSLTQTTSGFKEDNNTIAVYLYSFTKYIEWPYRPKSKPFVFAFYGYSPVVTKLMKNTTGKMVSGRKTEIKIFNSPEEINECQVLFLSKYTLAEWIAIDKIAQKKNILTITHNKKQGAKNACISFLNMAGATKFEIDKKRIQLYGLKISADLLRMAVPEKN